MSPLYVIGWLCCIYNIIDIFNLFLLRTIGLFIFIEMHSLKRIWISISHCSNVGMIIVSHMHWSWKFFPAIPLYIFSNYFPNWTYDYNAFSLHITCRQFFFNHRWKPFIILSSESFRASTQKGKNDLLGSRCLSQNEHTRNMLEGKQRKNLEMSHFDVSLRMSPNRCDLHLLHLCLFSAPMSDHARSLHTQFA